MKPIEEPARTSCHRGQRLDLPLIRSLQPLASKGVRRQLYYVATRFLPDASHEGGEPCAYCYIIPVDEPLDGGPPYNLVVVASEDEPLVRELDGLKPIDERPQYAPRLLYG